VGRRQRQRRALQTGTLAGGAGRRGYGLRPGLWRVEAIHAFSERRQRPRTLDPSNGGTRPQNYVNIASSCIDKAYPSIYCSLKQGATEAEDVIMFRWRVKQQAHTYARGPSPGNFGTTDPWGSALWTVLFDVDGDGIRDLAAHLDGSSGAPATPVDMIAGIWGRIPTQSIDYNDDPVNIHLIATTPQLHGLHRRRQQHHPELRRNNNFAHHVLAQRGGRDGLGLRHHPGQADFHQFLQRVLHRLPDTRGHAGCHHGGS
jgi:hypothetical protein